MTEIQKSDKTVLTNDKETNYNFLIICDHASNYIPKEYKNLGLHKRIRSSHIAYDIGAAGTAIELATKLGCPIVLSEFSRLLIDPNRGLDDRTLIMKISERNKIPGNIYDDLKKEKEERKYRISKFYRPYHRKIEECINRARGKGLFPGIVSIHSFSPSWKGIKRSFDVGFLWDKDDRMARIFFRYFKENEKLKIGDNKPYSGRLRNDTLYKHATSRGLPHLLIEIKQDLISDQNKVLNMANLLSKPLLLNEKNKEIFEEKFFGSNTLF